MPTRQIASPRMFALRGALAAVVIFLSACALVNPVPPKPAPEKAAPPTGERSLEVMATAYNSLPAQTTGNGTLTAFALRLHPGMRIVAVSRDLEALGLREGVRIRIEGLEGEWEVGDRLSDRWSERIDIYMGLDVDGAREWGKKRVRIWWKE